jgi:hypothetical protein
MKLTREYTKKYGWIVRLEQANTIFEGIGKTLAQAMTQALKLTGLFNDCTAQARGKK